VGYGSPSGSWLALGVGLNAGVAYVGNVGSAVVDFTALSDTVNVASRLQGAADAGQLVVAADLLDDLNGQLPGAQEQTVEVRGHGEPVPALVVTAG